jgi:alginate O-acetyltransferase complex protein AlgI
LFVHGSLRNTSIEELVGRLPRLVVTGVWAVMLCAIILTQGSGNAFIYFQF